MNKGKVVSFVAENILPVLAEMDIELVDIQYIKEGGRWFLRVFIDKPGGIGLEDCQNVSHSIDPLLDEKDPIPHPYTLEVSSPGLDRPLKKLADFKRFIGEMINLATFVPVENRRKFKGKLIEANEYSVTLEVDGNSISISMEQIASACLIAEL